MANPEQGPEQQGIIGTWQTVSLEVPDFLEPVRNAVDAFFNFLIQILDLLIGVLELLKVFATGFLDPLIAIIEALRNLIEALLNDLRQLGIYLHGDFYSLEGPDFQALKGGFNGYEGRMVARLADTSDPNRPDVSENSTCVAVFLYAGTDVRNINNIVNLIKSILGLFNRRFPVRRMMGRVSGVQATYGYDGATIFSYNQGFFRGFDFVKRSVDENINAPYNAVNLTWQMSPLPGPTYPDTPVLPPAGFIVEFTTLEQPLKVVCERPIEGTLEELTLNNQPAKMEVVECLDGDGNPIEVRGGLDEIEIRGPLNWNDGLDASGQRKPDAVRVYAIKNLSDQAPVQLSDLQEGDRYYLQRRFFVPFAQNLFFPGKGFGATFQFENMPYAAEWTLDSDNRLTRINDEAQPERFFVRIRATSRAIGEASDFRYLADQTSLRDRDGPVLPMAESPSIDLNDAGPPSPLTPILFPDASTQLYLRAVAEALAVMALSRADLPVVLGLAGPVDFPPQSGQALANGNVEPYWEAYEDQARLATGLENLARFLMIRLAGRRQIKRFFGEAGSSVAKFRRRLFVNCINLTNRMLTENLPPLPARQLVVERATDLLAFKVLFTQNGFITTIDPAAEAETGLPGGSLLELLLDDNRLRGVAPNPLSLDISDGRASDRAMFEMLDSLILVRSPHFFFAAQGDTTRGRGSFDMAPVLYNRGNTRIRQVAFVRNKIPNSVYEGAQFALQVAAGPQVRPQERGWIAFRLFPQGIPSIDRFFDQILALLRSIQAAIDSIAESIKRYIEYLQSRLRELQAFLNRINALIDRLLRFFFSVNPAAGLVVVAPGTNGVMTALLAAQNKPRDRIPALSDTYGGGVVLFAGGIPSIALDVFTALFKGST